MRHLLFLLVIIVGLGALMLLVLNDSATLAENGLPQDTVTIVPAMVQTSQPTTLLQLTEVDRGDDPALPLLCTTAEQDCSLRAAIEIANQDGGPTEITFDDHYMITLERPLPTLVAADTVIHADAGQQIYVNGNNLPAAVFSIHGSGIRLEGLHIFGAGSGYPNISVTGTAHDVTIAHNVIGDDDAPDGNCGQNGAAYGGISVTAVAAEPEAIHAWIYGNIIECHTGQPGVGIYVRTDRVVIGHDGRGCGSGAMENVVRENHGYGIDLGDHSGNVICNNQLHRNQAGNLIMTNFNNDLLHNDVD